jgi:hypothetical protein
MSLAMVMTAQRVPQGTFELAELVSAFEFPA